MNKLQTKVPTCDTRREADIGYLGLDSVPAGCMIEGISGVRYVIAVSGLIPHGASLLSTWWQFTNAAATASFCFLFLVLWTQTQAAGSHINQRLFSCLLSGSMARKRKRWCWWCVLSVWEQELLAHWGGKMSWKGWAQWENGWLQVSQVWGGLNTWKWSLL